MSLPGLNPTPNFRGPVNLSVTEVKWRDRQPFLESMGYMLRPRLRPGWTPSWISAGKHYEFFEDSVRLPVSRLDRLLDGCSYIFCPAPPFAR